MLAIQGPQAQDKLLQSLTPEQCEAVNKLSRFEFFDSGGLFIASTGYTGEAGYEILLSAEHVEHFWQKMIASGISPCGLGARDTLRLEAGLNLYGLDMDESITPFDCGLAWTVAFDPADRLFLGRSALERIKIEGLRQQFVGIILDEKGVLRAHQTIYSENHLEGVITSGTFSPTLGLGIGLARVPVAFSPHCFVEIRGKKIRAKLVSLPFVRQGKIVYQMLEDGLS
jgi:aminomethyltransferase